MEVEAIEIIKLLEVIDKGQTIHIFMTGLCLGILVVVHLIRPFK